MNKMNDQTRTDVTEAAVMQTISQNTEIRKYLKDHDTPVSFREIVANAKLDSNDPDMQILRSYVNSNPSNGNYKIYDYKSFGEGNGHCALISNGSNTFVAYDGTGKNGWIDNGEGLSQVSTTRQEMACNQFDKYATDPKYAELMKYGNNITIVGHSKGGNEAMYTTMSSKHADRITRCVSIDGQGFSPEAKNHWESEYYGTGEYKERVDKIISVSGQYDYVNEQGISIANKENTYVLDYQERNAAGKTTLAGIKGGAGFAIGGAVGTAIAGPLGGYIGGKLGAVAGSGLDILGLGASLHSHEYMFQRTFNPETGQFEFTCNLNKETEPSVIHTALNDFMSQYMSLSRDDRAASAPAVMKIFQKAFGGEAESITSKDIEDIVSSLLKTDVGVGLSAGLINSFMGVIVLVDPLLALPVSIYCASILQKILSNRQQGIVSVGSVNISSSNEILLNQEMFMAMKASFNCAFNEAMEAASYAEKAESLQHNASVCGALSKTVSKKSEDINVIMQKVVDSFSATDKELAKAAQSIGESYLGKEVYKMA